MKNSKVIENTVPTRSSGALFATEVDALIIDVERSAEYHGRKAIRSIIKSTSFAGDVEAEFLKDGLVRYYQCMIIGGIKMISETPGDNLKGYAHHALTKLWISVDLHTALDVLGEVSYDQRVIRKVFFDKPKNITMMTVEKALEFSARLHNFLADTGFTLVQGVPHNDIGDKLAMSLAIVKDDNQEKLCTHLTDDMPDAEFMSTLYPKRGNNKGVIEESSRIPVTMAVGTIDELNYSVSILN